MFQQFLTRIGRKYQIVTKAGKFVKRESFKIVYIFAKRFDDFYLTFSRLFIFGRQKIVNSNVIKLSRFFFHFRTE